MDLGQTESPAYRQGSQQRLASIYGAGREQGRGEQWRKAAWKHHPTPFPCFLFRFPSTPSNPTLGIHRLQILLLRWQQQQQHTAVQRGEKEQLHPKKVPRSAGSHESPAMGFERKRIGSIFLGIGLAGGTAYKEQPWSEDSSGTS